MPPTIARLRNLFSDFFDPLRRCNSRSLSSDRQIDLFNEQLLSRKRIALSLKRVHDKNGCLHSQMSGKMRMISGKKSNTEILYSYRFSSSLHIIVTRTNHSSNNKPGIKL